jgi:hypothetical protein
MSAVLQWRHISKRIFDYKSDMADTVSSAIVRKRYRGFDRLLTCAADTNPLSQSYGGNVVRIEERVVIPAALSLAVQLVKSSRRRTREILIYRTIIIR